MSVLALQALLDSVLDRSMQNQDEAIESIADTLVQLHTYVASERLHQRTVLTPATTKVLDSIRRVLWNYTQEAMKSESIPADKVGVMSLALISLGLARSSLNDALCGVYLLLTSPEETESDQAAAKVHPSTGSKSQTAPSPDSEAHSGASGQRGSLNDVLSRKRLMSKKLSVGLPRVRVKEAMFASSGGDRETEDPFGVEEAEYMPGLEMQSSLSTEVIPRAMPSAVKVDNVLTH